MLIMVTKVRWTNHEWAYHDAESPAPL